VAFRIEQVADDGFRLIGELDMATADGVYRRLAPSLNGGGVRLDLSRLTFIDCAGIHTLVALSKRLSDGNRIVLERPTEPVRRVFAVIGAKHRLPNLEIRDGVRSAA
jgi:anti-anti-sigma factor